MADTHASGACAFFKREGSTPFLRIAKIPLTFSGTPLSLTDKGIAMVPTGHSAEAGRPGNILERVCGRLLNP